MRYDMHCHTKEGSLDAKVPVTEYARLLQKRGFTGMLVTDHNSYKGYRAWCKAKKELKRKNDPLADFVVLKGIESVSYTHLVHSALFPGGVSGSYSG